MSEREMARAMPMSRHLYASLMPATAPMPFFRREHASAMMQSYCLCFTRARLPMLLKMRPRPCARVHFDYAMPASYCLAFHC